MHTTWDIKFEFQNHRDVDENVEAMRQSLGYSSGC
jgi:hypothetical protein